MQNQDIGDWVWTIIKFVNILKYQQVTSNR